MSDQGDPSAGDERRIADAICGAYLAIAFADAHFHEAEETRLLGGVVNDPSLTAVDADTVSAAYNHLVALFEQDYRDGLAEAVAAIEATRDDGALTAAISMAARTALVADNALSAQEEAALRAVEKALGLDEGAL